MQIIPGKDERHITTQVTTQGDTRTEPMLRVPAYEALRLQVKQAVIDAGIDVPGDLDTWSAKLVLAADGSEQAGLTDPWYLRRHKSIRNLEGGRQAIVESIAALAIGLMMHDPTLDRESACLEAGNQWRASIRPQWDYRAGEQQAKSIEQMVANLGEWGDTPDYPELHVHDHIGLTVEHPADIEEPEGELVTLLREGIGEVLSDNEQVVVEMRSGGMTYEAIADELDWYGRQSAYATFNRAKRKLKDYIEERKAA